MFKRTLLVFTFIAVLCVVGVGIGNKAMAWSDCGSSNYVDAYPYPYTSYYATYGAGWAPRVAYYPTYPIRSYPVFYGRDYDRHHHHDHHHDGLRISVGF
jgi:hypothetical protein